MKFKELMEEILKGKGIHKDLPISIKKAIKNIEIVDDIQQIDGIYKITINYYEKLNRQKIKDIISPKEFLYYDLHDMSIHYKITGE